MSKPKKVAVIGAGWAGSASALTLHKQGFDVTVFDSARMLGGRARGLQDDTFGMLDNGQHLMLGAYQETLKLIAQLNPGVAENQLLAREPLYLMSVAGDIHLKVKQFWPAPLNTLAGLLTAKGLSWADKFSMIRLMVGLISPTSKRSSKSTLDANDVSTTPNGQAYEQHAPQYTAHHDTVLGWLIQQKQSHSVIQKIWQPLCLAMLNTPIESACAQLFQNVLRDSLGSSVAGATDMVLPRTDLSTLAPQRLIELVDCRLGQTVRHITCHDAGIDIEGERFDGCIIATPPHNTLRLIKESLNHTALYQQLVHQLNQFTYAPITTCYLRLSHPFNLPAPMMMLSELPDRGHIGQWVFKRHTQGTVGDGNDACDLAVIISDSSGLLDRVNTLKFDVLHNSSVEAVSSFSDARSNTHQKYEPLVQALHQQIAEQLMQRPSDVNRHFPALQAFRVFTEKRATFVATPGLARPSNFTGDSRVMLAGDWTDTGYPAVIEGAVRSGLKAAQGLFSF